MAMRPLTFGIRLRDKGRTVRVTEARGGFLVEDSRVGSRPRRREHASLTAAIRDTASIWRSRLH